jgi:hypothetical protein
MTEATSWDDLYAVLAEVDGACVNGVISHDDVAALDGFAADRSHDIPQHAEDGHLSELFARRPVLRVRSRLLGEVVVWLSNEAEAPEGTDEVVYREAELRRLVGRDPVMIQAIHQVVGRLQQGRHRRAVPDAVVGQVGGHDLAALCIDGQVQLTPGSVARPKASCIP